MITFLLIFTNYYFFFLKLTHVNSALTSPNWLVSYFITVYEEKQDQSVVFCYILYTLINISNTINLYFWLKFILIYVCACACVFQCKKNCYVNFVLYIAASLFQFLYTHKKILKVLNIVIKLEGFIQIFW